MSSDLIPPETRPGNQGCAAIALSTGERNGVGNHFVIGRNAVKGNGEGNGVRNHFIIEEEAIVCGYGESEASGCGRDDLSCAEPRESQPKEEVAKIREAIKKSRPYGSEQ
jgi:hypothetical protein